MQTAACLELLPLPCRKKDAPDLLPAAGGRKGQTGKHPGKWNAGVKSQENDGGWTYGYGLVNLAGPFSVLGSVPFPVTGVTGAVDAERRKGQRLEPRLSDLGTTQDTEAVGTVVQTLDGR